MYCTPVIRILFHIVIALVLTVVTQLGGLAWLIALCFKRRVLSFLAIYIMLSGVALWAAPMFRKRWDPNAIEVLLRV